MSVSLCADDARVAFPLFQAEYQDLDAHTGTIYKASGWKHAENFKPRARGWIGWGTRPRKGRTNQSVAPRMRWECEI